MTPLRIQLAELSIVDGMREKRGYNVRFVEPAPDTPYVDRGSLVILVDMQGPKQRKRRYLRQIMNTIQSTYYASAEGPIPMALVHAIRTAHHELLNINDALPDGSEPYTCHVTGMVLYENDVYLVQVGATTVAVLLPTGLEWFSPLQDEEGDAKPIGIPHHVRPKTSHITVVPDTMILMLDSGWLGQMDANLFRRAISHSSPEDVLEELAAAVQVPTVSALALKVVEMVEETETEGPTYIVKEAEEEEERLPWEEPAIAEEGETPEEEEGPSVIEQARSFVERLLPGQKEEPPEPPTVPEPPPIRRPTFWPFRKKTTEKGEPRRWRHSLWILVVLIPLLILAATSYTWWHHAREQERLYETALSDAREAIAQAAAATTREDARMYLRRAEQALHQAELIHPNAPDIERLRLQIQDIRMDVEQIKPLSVMWSLATWSGKDPTRVLAQENEVYVLDRAEDAVYRYTLNETGEGVVGGEQRLFARGDLVDDKSVGDLVDMGWLPAGMVVQMSSLVVLDGAGILFTYDSMHGPRTLPFVRPDLWLSPQRMLVYAERLYVLDPQAGKLYRFPPTGEGYTAGGEDYFATPTNISGVQDFAIDGHVYLLFPDGRLLRYYRGEQQGFDVETTFSSPTAIYTTDELQHLYIADAGNKRIVVLDKEGKFVAQLVPGEGYTVDFSTLQDIFVTPDEKTIYILTTTGLWRAPLPIR